ncbi:MAG TPA: hypothetical protein VMY16_05065 [Ilumatobacteraceae bacterium]|nr:hypothetical protein [Ilumatobacteraceae bacterium]
MTATDVDATDLTLIGAVGTSCRAWVSRWGDVVPDRGPEDSSTLQWFIAAEDRWHVPSSEPAVRQRRIDGTPVIETRVRVPEGDAIQRVWSVPDAGGLTVIEVENASSLPFAVAFAGTRVLTERPPADVPIRGIDLPDGAIVLPVAHSASVRVAIPHDSSRFATWALPTLAPAMAIVRGWETIVHRASRLVLPDADLGDAVTTARSDLLLAGPIDGGDDAIGFLLDVAELARLGDDPDAWMPEIVEPIASIARSDSSEVDVALRACERLAVSAGDDRAAGDIAAVRRRRLRDGRSVTVSGTAQSSFSDLRRGESVGRFVADVERRVADEGRLLPLGIPHRWLGSNFEVHGVPTGARSTVGFAVRWHGERPAVLWEQHGDIQSLTAPAVDADWSSDAASGEALWSAPPQPKRIGVSIDLGDR